MRNPELINGDIAHLEKELASLLLDLDYLDKQEMDSEPAHRKMVSELMNADFIAKLPNQTMRDDALEDYMLNNDQYRDKHLAYLLLKMNNRQKYRRYRFLEECMKNRRTELQASGINPSWTKETK
jgi:thiaminase